MGARRSPTCCPSRCRCTSAFRDALLWPGYNVCLGQNWLGRDSCCAVHERHWGTFLLAIFHETSLAQYHIDRLRSYADDRLHCGYHAPQECRDYGSDVLPSRYCPCFGCVRYSTSHRTLRPSGHLYSRCGTLMVGFWVCLPLLSTSRPYNELF